MGQLADHPILPEQVEFRHRQGREVGQDHLNALLGTDAFRPMKLVNTKLPDRQRLEDRALAAVVAPDQKVKLREIVDLLAHAFEICQGQSRNHFCVSVFRHCGTFAGRGFMSTRWFEFGCAGIRLLCLSHHYPELVYPNLAKNHASHCLVEWQACPI